MAAAVVRADSFYLDEFDTFNEQGNAANRNGRYTDAIKLYTKALTQVKLIGGISETDVAKVLSNRSLAALKLGWIEIAIDDGMKSTQIDPTWVKGYWRASSALKEKNELIQSLRVLVDGYSKIIENNEEAIEDKICFIKKIAMLSEILSAWPEAEELFYSCRAPPKVWNKVVLQLARKKQTKVLHLVFLGGRLMVQAGIGGMASSCDASLVELQPLIRSMGPSDRNQYGMDLMLVLIKHGADWTGLSINPGDTPLHVALNHGMEIGNYDFLEYLFSHHAKTRVERSRTDNEGATLLHIASKQSGKQRQSAVLFLLKENVDPSIEDNKGKTPADYIDDWMLVRTLRSEMKQMNVITEEFYQSGSGQLPSCTVLPERVRHRFSQPIPSQWASQNENDMQKQEGLKEESYKMTSMPRGICIIINNMQFTCHFPNREGSEFDEDKLKSVFKHLGFTVSVVRNATAEDMGRLIEDASQMDHEKFDCFICCILSHGEEGIVFSTDGGRYKINDITNAFVECRTLAGKPKLFFLQACQGDRMSLPHELQTDSMESIPDNTDILVAYPTSPGDIAFRSPTSGSIYIKTLTDALWKFHNTNELLEILRHVNNEVSKYIAEIGHGRPIYKQAPSPRFSLRKKLFFKVEVRS